jgi:CubicO group peptidase (beta-lactamase class C family)
MQPKGARRLGPAFFLACTLLCSRAQAADQFQPVRDAIKSLMIERHTPSLAVAVSLHGKIIWEQGFGFADLDKGTLATADTMYSLASISKPITGTALMTLVSAGKINLDKPINDYLGKSKLQARVGDAEDATVRRVANHSSGLPEHFQFFYRNEPWSVPQPDLTIMHYGNLVTAPGEIFRYSNLGYGVLSYAISRVSGQSFADYVRHKVFDKLGMTHSAVGNDPALASFEATRYGDDLRPIPLYDTDHEGASAIYASAHDLARFGIFGLKEHMPNQNPILSDGMIDVMQAPTMDEGDGMGYGVGWETSTMGGVKMLAHTGGMPGVATELRLIPSKGLVIVVLTNTGDNRLTHMITDQIISIEIPGWKRPTAEIQPSLSLPVALAGVWKGEISTYQGAVPLTLTVSDRGDVKAKLGDQLDTLLNNARFGADGFLQGAMQGSLPIEDTARRPHAIGINLKLRNGSTLNGSITARAGFDGTSPTHGLFPSVNGQPAPTEVQNKAFILAQWAELKRQ